MLPNFENLKIGRNPSRHLVKCPQLTEWGSRGPRTKEWKGLATVTGVWWSGGEGYTVLDSLAWDSERS